MLLIFDVNISFENNAFVAGNRGGTDIFSSSKVYYEYSSITGE